MKNINISRLWTPIEHPLSFPKSIIIGMLAPIAIVDCYLNHSKEGSQNFWIQKLTPFVPLVLAGAAVGAGICLVYHFAYSYLNEISTSLPLVVLVLSGALLGAWLCPYIGSDPKVKQSEGVNTDKISFVVTDSTSLSRVEQKLGVANILYPHLINAAIGGGFGALVYFLPSESGLTIIGYAALTSLIINTLMIVCTGKVVYHFFDSQSKTPEPAGANPLS